MDINEKVVEFQKDTNSQECKNFIVEHKPFILSVVSKRLNRYISSQNDEVFAIGLSAFLESIEQFNSEKGHFYSFARLVIDRRVKNYMTREERFAYENIDDLVIEDQRMSIEDQVILKDEIQNFEKKLAYFNISFNDLVEEVPTHKKTREQAILIGEKTSEEKNFVEHLYLTKRLPVTKMCQKFLVTRKVIYGSKNFIISVIVIFVEKFSLIKKWI